MSFYRSTKHKGVVAGSCLVLLALVVASLCIVPLIVMVCWNAVAPATPITFWQALAGYILVCIVGGAFRSVTHKG
jgi:hypothetical protein